MGDDKNTSIWIPRLLCGGKTRTKVYEDTVLLKFPLYCLKCKLRSPTAAGAVAIGHCAARRPGLK